MYINIKLIFCPKEMCSFCIKMFAIQFAFAGDIASQAKDSGAKFIVSSLKCAAKSVDVKDKLSQQIKV